MSVTLRTRISIIFGLAIMVIVSLTTFIAEQVTARNLESAFDSDLQKHVHTIAAIISSDITPDEASYSLIINDLARQKFSFVPLYMRVTSQSGKLIMDIGKVSDGVITEMDGELHSADIISGRFDTIKLDGFETLRVYSITVNDPKSGLPLAAVQAVEAIGQIDQVKTQLWRNSLLIGLGGSLLAGIAGMFLFRRWIKPMQKIINSINATDYNHLKTELREEHGLPELQQLSSSLTAMWERLELAVDSKRRVIGSISHDLKTPLTVLQGQLEVLLMQESLNKDTRDSLERMLGETQRLIRMVKNMLLNVQLETNPIITGETVDLKSLLDETIGDIWVLAKGQRLEIDASQKLSVKGDRDLLKQMLLNIIENAIKFTPLGGSIKLSLARQEGNAVLTITDSGRGFSDEGLLHATEPFYKTEPKQRVANQGAHLGLAIVKQIVELHHGTLKITSQINTGTSVIVSIPLN